MAPFSSLLMPPPGILPHRPLHCTAGRLPEKKTVFKATTDMQECRVELSVWVKEQINSQLRQPVHFRVQQKNLLIRS